MLFHLCIFNCLCVSVCQRVGVCTCVEHEYALQLPSDIDMHPSSARLQPPSPLSPSPTTTTTTTTQEERGLLARAAPSPCPSPTTFTLLPTLPLTHHLSLLGTPCPPPRATCSQERPPVRRTAERRATDTSPDAPPSPVAGVGGGVRAGAAERRASGTAEAGADGGGKLPPPSPSPRPCPRCPHLESELVLLRAHVAQLDSALSSQVGGKLPTLAASAQ